MDVEKPPSHSELDSESRGKATLNAEKENRRL